MCIRDRNTSGWRNTCTCTASRTGRWVLYQRIKNIYRQADHQGFFHKNSRRYRESTAKPGRLHPVGSGRRRNGKDFWLVLDPWDPETVFPCRRDRSLQPWAGDPGNSPLCGGSEQQCGDWKAERSDEDPAGCGYCKRNKNNKLERNKVFWKETQRRI